MRRLLGVLSLAATILATGTCSDSTGTVAVDHVVVSGRALLRVGETVLFGAQVFDVHNNVLSGHPVTWSSSDPAVATVSTGGSVNTLAPGQTMIAATAEGVTGTLPVTVTVRPVATVVVSPAVDSLITGDSLRLTASPRDSAGGPLTGRTIQWRSSDTAKAVVDSTGLVHTRAVGGVAISATSEGQIGGGFLEVQDAVVSLQLPDTVTLTTREVVQIIPDLRSSGNVHLADRAVTWVSDDTAIVRVSTSGVLTPVTVGQTRVRAACCAGLADTSVIHVVAESTRHIDLSGPTFQSVYVDSVTRYSAVLLDRFNLPTDRPVAWTAADSAIAQVIPDSQGSPGVTVRGLRAGVTMIEAVSDTAHASEPLNVQLPADRLVLDPDTVRLRVGEVSPIHQTLQDAAGTVHADPAGAQLVVVDTAVARLVDGIQGVAPGETEVIGSEAIPFVVTDTMVVIVSPDSGTRLDWNPIATFADSGIPLTVTVSLTDSAGAQLPVGEDVRLESEDSTIVSVTPSLLPTFTGSASITLFPHRGGAVTLVARTDSLARPFWARVLDGWPIASLSFVAPPIVQVGDSVAIVVSSLDANGTPRPYPVTWSSSDSGVAVVTDSSVLVGRGGGRALLTVRSGGLSDTATVTVPSNVGPTVTGVAPSLLLADSIVTIIGANFDPVAGNDQVLVDGVPAMVTAASDTQLTVQLAAPVSYPCLATHPAVVSVATTGGLGATTAGFSAARQVSLQPGEVTPLYPVGTGACLELAQTGGAYDFAVANGTPSAASAVDFRMRAAGATAVPAPPVAMTRLGEPASGPALIDLARQRSRLSLHMRVLEETRALAQRVGSPVPLLQARRHPALSVADSVGDLVRFRIPEVDRPDFCASYQSVTARRAYVGTHLDIYEDQDNLVAGRMDTAFARLGQEFDTVMYPLLVANFGDPLVLDSLLDRNHKIVLLISPKVNEFASGFVTGCDFYPEAVAPSSNTGEIIYAFAPTSTAADFEPGSISEWQWLIRSVLMHESKHVAAIAQRLWRGAPLEEPWLEEGTAVIAEELWARGVYGTSWRGGAAYAQTLYCDVRPTMAPCVGRPYSMFNAFALLYDYADGYATPPGNEAHSPLGPTDPSDASFYGSAWSLLRWSIDQYATSESAFLSALVQDPVRTGTANLEARTGRAFPALVADWLLASQLDEQTVPAPFGIPSWNTRDIFAGMNTDFPTTFLERFPYRLRASAFGDVTIPIRQVHGGTGSVFRLEGTQSAKQLIAIEGLDGGSAPAGLWLEVLRIQ